MANINSARRGIARFDDLNNGDILLACDLTSLTSRIGVDGTQNGTPVFSDDGMNPNGAGSVIFSGVDNGNLKWAGQIVVTVTTTDISQYDDHATHVTGSNGVLHSSGWVALFGLKDSGGGQAGRLLVTNIERLDARFDTGETDAGAYVHSAVYGDTCEVCLWWEGSIGGILVDGTPVKSLTRTTSIGQDNFTDIVVGANYLGNGNYFTGTIKNVVISTVPPARHSQNTLRSLQFFGDSYAAHASETIVLPRASANAGTVLRGLMMEKGIDVPFFADGSGGFSVCDTGASDLSSTIDAAAAKGAYIVVFMAGNNDVDASDVQIADGSTGTDANYKSFINSFAANNGTRKVYITTIGSLFQDSVLNTPTKNTRLATINTIINALPAWWDATNPTETGFVEVIDLFTLMGGDLTTNLNYKGQTDDLGNLTIASGGGMTDRHLSYLGEISFGGILSEKLIK